MLLMLRSFTSIVKIGWGVLKSRIGLERDAFGVLVGKGVLDEKDELDNNDAVEDESNSDWKLVEDCSLVVCGSLNFNESLNCNELLNLDELLNSDDALKSVVSLNFKELVNWGELLKSDNLVNLSDELNFSESLKSFVPVNLDEAESPFDPKTIVGSNTDALVKYWESVHADIALKSDVRLNLEDLVYGDELLNDDDSLKTVAGLVMQR